MGTQIKSNRMEKTYKRNIKKKDRIAILVIDKVGFKTNILGEIKKHFIIIKKLNYKEDITIQISHKYSLCQVTEFQNM